MRPCICEYQRQYLFINAVHKKPIRLDMALTIAGTIPQSKDLGISVQEFSLCETVTPQRSPTAPSAVHVSRHALNPCGSVCRRNDTVHQINILHHLAHVRICPMLSRVFADLLCASRIASSSQVCRIAQTAASLMNDLPRHAAFTAGYIQLPCWRVLHPPAPSDPYPYELNHCR